MDGRKGLRWVVSGRMDGMRMDGWDEDGWMG